MMRLIHKLRPLRNLYQIILIYLKLIDPYKRIDLYNYEKNAYIFIHEKNLYKWICEIRFNT